VRSAPVLVVLIAVAAAANQTSAQPLDEGTALPSAGPALGGNRVFWAEETVETIFVLMRAPGSGAEVVHRQHSTPGRQDWGVVRIAASPSLVAFGRAWNSCGGGICGYGGDDLWAGRPRGPFTRYAHAPYLPCGSGLSFDVDRSTIVFSESFCRRGKQRSHVVLRRFPHGPAIELENAPAKSYCCGDVAIAGNFVAWSAGRAIVVYDLAARRTAYRAALPNGSQRGVDFDLGTDGTLVVAIDNRRGIIDEDKLWVGSLFQFSLGEPAPRPRKLRGRAVLHRLGRRLRLVDGRLLYDRHLDAKRSELVLRDFAGGRRRLALFGPGERVTGDLDLTSTRAAWATRKDTELRRECTKICRTVADGVIRIWVARIDRRGSKPRLIAERPYSGLHPIR
jgi:hypothetical protein